MPNRGFQGSLPLPIRAIHTERNITTGCSGRPAARPVAEPERKMAQRVDLMQTVGWYYHPIEAEIARGLLESEGLTPFLHSKHHAWANWLQCIALGGIRLQVPYWEVPQAQDILSLPEVTIDADVCASCGSENTQLIKLWWRIVFIVFHTFLIPLPFKITKRKCADCGDQWREN